MENFKSYYGRLEIGPFHRRFTAIVGPNGTNNNKYFEVLENQISLNPYCLFSVSAPIG